MFVAGPLEAEQTCPRCQNVVQVGQSVGRCSQCRHIQHETCWREAGQCCSYECAAATAEPPGERRPDVVVTSEEVAAAPVSVPPVVLSPGMARPPLPVKKKLSILALLAFVCALVGAVLFGIPGLLAIVLGAVAIGIINTRKNLKGTGFAAAAIIIGVIDIVGWGAAAGLFFLRDHARTTPGDFAIEPPLGEHFEPEDLVEVPEPIRRAIRANVIIVARARLATAEGAGIVLETRGTQVMILTNRHVIDGPGFRAHARSVDITFSDGSRAKGTVEWRGPPGVDAAVVACDLDGGLPEPAPVRMAPRLVIGEPVFAIGNPIGLGWTYSKGVISAIRKQTHESGILRMIQTQTPLNPGNSGGGLYDANGNLVGLNTLKMGEFGTEGIGFAIGMADLVPFLEQQAGLKLRKAGVDLDSDAREQP